MTSARRAVDCAPYLTLRFRVFALKMRTHGAMHRYQRNKIFLGRDASPRHPHTNLNCRQDTGSKLGFS